MDSAPAIDPDASSQHWAEELPSSSPPPPPATSDANGQPAATVPPRESKRPRWTKTTDSAHERVPATARFGLRQSCDVVRDEDPYPRRVTDRSPPPPPPRPPSTALRPPPLRLRTATSLQSSWQHTDNVDVVNGGHKAYHDQGAANNSSSRYTSLRELILSTSPPATDSTPAATAASASASASAAADHHDLQSPRYAHNHYHLYSVSVDSIAIRNPLLKQAAYAYLRPTTPPAPEPRRSWLTGPRHQLGHPDDDGRYFDDYCGAAAGAGGGLLCGGVGLAAGWVAGVVRCLFRRVFGRAATAATSAKTLDSNATTNGVWEQR